MAKALVLVAALAAISTGAVIDPRQVRPTSRPVQGGTPDGTEAPIRVRDPQRPPQFSLGRPSQSVTLWPGSPDDQLEKCGLDAFVGHTAEALLFCSSILKGGTLTTTTTYTARATTTMTSTAIVTLNPPTSRSSTVRPPTSTPRPSTSTVRSSSSTRPSTSTRPSSTPSSTRPSTTSPPRVSSTSSSVRPSTTLPPTTTTTPRPSSTSSSPTPSTTAAPGCGIVGYTKSTAAYYFDSSGTRNNFAACSSACKADSKCKSFGYGESNCMLFDVLAADNTNYNPMSPYTFYDASCPSELPVKKRQIQVSLELPGGPSSACACLIPTGVYATTKTVVASVTSARVTKTETVTRTVSLLPPQP